jgi:hypothetical protein
VSALPFSLPPPAARFRVSSAGSSELIAVTGFKAAFPKAQPPFRIEMADSRVFAPAENVQGFMLGLFQSQVGEKDGGPHSCNVKNGFMTKGTFPSIHFSRTGAFLLANYVSGVIRIRPVLILGHHWITYVHTYEKNEKERLVYCSSLELHRARLREKEEEIYSLLISLDLPPLG